MDCSNPSTTKLNRLEENIGAVHVELTPDVLQLIEGAASKVTVRGARYSESFAEDDQSLRGAASRVHVAQAATLVFLRRSRYRQRSRPSLATPP